MGLARVAVEVLVGAVAVVGTLPELAQVRVDVLVAVGGITEAVGGGARATGAGAGSLRRASRPPRLTDSARHYGLYGTKLGRGIRIENLDRVLKRKKLFLIRSYRIFL